MILLKYSRKYVGPTCGICLTKVARILFQLLDANCKSYETKESMNCTFASERRPYPNQISFFEKSLRKWTNLYETWMLTALGACHYFHIWLFSTARIIFKCSLDSKRRFIFISDSHNKSKWTKHTTIACAKCIRECTGIDFEHRVEYFTCV